MAANIYWSPERDMALRVEYTIGRPVDEIKRLLDAIDGPPVPLERIRLRANALGLVRPASFIANLRRKSAKASNEKRAWTPAQMEAVRTMRADGASALMIHKVVNTLGPKRTLSSVMRVAKRGVSSTPKPAIEPPAQVVAVFVPSEVSHRAWSDERHNVILRDWPLGVEKHEVLRRINALPGPPVSAGSLRMKASTLGVRRPAWFMSEKGKAGAVLANARWKSPVARTAPVPGTPAKPLVQIVPRVVKPYKAEATPDPQPWQSLKKPSAGFSMLGGRSR